MNKRERLSGTAYKRKRENKAVVNEKAAKVMRQFLSCPNNGESENVGDGVKGASTDHYSSVSRINY
jgi:hypothetical protein